MESRRSLSAISNDATFETAARPRRWALGILETAEEVPGSVLLLSQKTSNHNAPLGMQHATRRSSSSSFPSPIPEEHQSEAMFGRIASQSREPEKKRTPDGKIILEPQPEDSKNDPLTWSAFRRDAALLSLGFYCLMGGGMTPVLAAGFTNVAADYDVSIPQVALTTGLYMLGLGIGSVVMSPTAIAIGKRPVYLFTSILFVLSAVWCALSPNYASLVVARVFMGIVVSPVECLPSASIAEIFFLHERAYRLGIYTLLLLGGKNLVPLVSAAIINSLGWRWVFWIVAIIVGFSSTLLFFFVPETFWDRTPEPSKHHGHTTQRPNVLRMWSSARIKHHAAARSDQADQSAPPPPLAQGDESCEGKDRNSSIRSCPGRHAHFASSSSQCGSSEHNADESPPEPTSAAPANARKSQSDEKPAPPKSTADTDTEATDTPKLTKGQIYTNKYRSGPTKTYLSTLKVWDGRLSHDNWFRVAARPFVLFLYPAILWSAVVYSLSVGWLIVLSESVATIYRNRETYNFTALQTGLVYISPFVGGILGSAVAGKVSDLIVRWMARRNGGVYEPEYRLVMAVPIALSTTVGLMGFGWSVQERDAWIVPTVFFGVISFGCSLGSTTSITFAVDSYRQYAGEALVTLNFAKNVLHGFIFSLFFTRWLEADGAKDVFLAIGGIQIACLLFSVPMYMYGKRARLWTVRRNLMERF